MYKVERYIKVCIDSILNQTFQDFEIIIVDDASPDNCYEICQKLYGENEKVRILRHENNKGLGPSRNTGIENARGKYVCFVDSDDLILPNALSTLYNAAKVSKADIIHVGGRCETRQDDDKDIASNNLEVFYEDYKGEGFLKNDLDFRLNKCWLYLYPTAWLNICNLEFLRKNNLKFTNVISEDETFLLDIVCTAEKFFIIKTPCYIYRRRPNSIMSAYDEKRFSNGVASLAITANHITDRINNTPALANKKDLQDIIWTGLLSKQINNHILPFYDGKNVTPRKKRYSANGTSYNQCIFAGIQRKYHVGKIFA